MVRPGVTEEFLTPSWTIGPLRMHATRNQRTIAKPAAVEGFGYWSGRDVRVEFFPAAVNTGIVFVRDDLPGRPRIEATTAHRTETPLRTTLRSGEAGVVIGLLLSRPSVIRLGIGPFPLALRFFLAHFRQLTLFGLPFQGA